MNGNQLIEPTSNMMPSFFKEDVLDLRKILMQLYRHIWFIISSAIIGFVVAFIHTISIQPQYQTSALIQINPTQTTNNLFSLGFRPYSSVSPIESELALIKTRYILEPVVKQNSLNNIVQQNYFPVFGEWMARRYHDIGVAEPFWGLNKYAWGGEKIQIKQFTVPSDFQGQTFQLEAGKGNSFKLYSEQNKLILTGTVGEFSSSTIVADFHLHISKLEAHPGTIFFISHQSPLDVANVLASQLSMEQVTGSNSNQNTGIMRLILKGSDPNRITHVLNAIVYYTIKKNSERKAKEAQTTLKFLHQRLPELKNSIYKAENDLNKYFAKSGIYSMELSNQLLIQDFLRTQQSLEQSKSQKNSLLQSYTSYHPLVISANQQEKDLQKKLFEIEKKFKIAPSVNQQGLNLEREVKIKDSMYQSLLNNMQQLEIAKAGIVSDIVALDDATPSILIPSKKKSVLAFGFLVGLLLASFVILIKNAMNKTIDDSEQLEDELQIPVQAIIPFSKKQKEMEKTSVRQMKILGKGFSLPLILAKEEPDDVAIESLRSLRISLHIMKPSVTHQCIAIMGSMSNIGKSFVALNLSQVLADSGKRTLLIDGDIRKGKLYQALRQPKSNGLSEFLAGKSNGSDIIHQVNNNLFFISCGKSSNHPIELFQSERFHSFIVKMKQEFDHIIIDTPPILAVIDPILIASRCETKLFVVNATKDYLSDVKQAIKKAQAHGIMIDGLVFNHRQPYMLYYGYGTRYYSYRYAYGNVKEKRSRVREVM